MCPWERLSLIISIPELMNFLEDKTVSCCLGLSRTNIRDHISIVRLSLLTMTNPNHLCDVLLFVCSKMADETNFSSKLPVEDRTREV